MLQWLPTTVPVYGHAHIEKDVVNLTGGVLSLDGQQKIEFSLAGKTPIELGQKLADQLIAAGASELLKEIRRQILRTLNCHGPLAHCGNKLIQGQMFGNIGRHIHSKDPCIGQNHSITVAIFQLLQSGL